LSPAIENVANDPRVTVGVFDEVADAALWRDLGNPRQPVRDRTRRRRHRPGKGDLQQPRPAGERPGDGGAAAVPEHLDRINRRDRSRQLAALAFSPESAVRSSR